MAKDKKIGIIYRPDISAVLNLAETLTTWLKDRGHQVFTGPEQKTIRGTKAIPVRKNLTKMDLIVVLGGDGTYLRSIRLLQGHSVPILGVNFGSLGFLTATRAEDLFSSVDLALKGKMKYRPRAMLHVQVYRKDKLLSESLVLNDLVIERGSLSQLINLKVSIEKSLVSEIKADGLIIASPTGSTAYNLAAGGPILHPEVRAIVVTPIAPHSLTSRPLIFPDDRSISISLVHKAHGRKLKAHLVVDGIKIKDLTEQDEIRVQRTNEDHVMVQDPAYDYFVLLREKLKFGDRS